MIQFTLSGISFTCVCVRSLTVTSAGSDSEIAPIVGGVVAGLTAVVVAVVIALVVMAVLRKRRQKAVISSQVVVCECLRTNPEYGLSCDPT